MHVTARLSESGSGRAARMPSCSDVKQLMDRHENDKKSKASTYNSLREASRLREHIRDR